MFAWAALSCRRPRPAAGSAASRAALRDEIRALIGDRRFIGYVLCGALGTAPFFTFPRRRRRMSSVSMMGRTSAEYGLWFAVDALGYMARQFHRSRATSALRHRPHDLVGHR